MKGVKERDFNLLNIQSQIPQLQLEGVVKESFLIQPALNLPETIQARLYILHNLSSQNVRVRQVV